MPHRLTIIIFVLASVQAAYLTQSWPSTLDCSFTLDGASYDLCHVFKRAPIRISLHKETTQDYPAFYQFDFRPIDERVADDEKEDISECSTGAWICFHHTCAYIRFIALFRRCSFPPSVDDPPINVADEHVPSFHPHDGPSHFFLDNNGHVSLILMGDYFQGQQQHTRIEFICDPDIDETKLLSFPELIETSDTKVHTFTWATKYGCGTLLPRTKRVVSPALLSITEGDEEQDETPDDSNESEENITPPSTCYTALLFPLAFFTMLIFGCLIYFPPSHLVAKYITPLFERMTHLPVQMKKVHLPRRFKSTSKRFRVAEGRLVRWAIEDTVLLGEEDAMVNTYDEEDDDWPMDEFIPLKPGMDMIRTKNYGTA